MSTELVIDTTPQPLIIGAEGDAELTQNVRLIASTFAWSVRFDVPFADFGEFIDSPLPHDTARLMAGLTAAVEKYEPRLSVKSIAFRGDAESTSRGIGYPVITVVKKVGN